MAVGLTAGLGLDGDRCIRVIPRQKDGPDSFNGVAKATLLRKKSGQPDGFVVNF